MVTLGEYRVVRQVGEGGMGKVFEAEERLSGRRVALKVLRPELARSEPGRRLFENEMAILAGLDHPNVVRCLCCTEVEGELVMVLELLEGRTLREVLAAEGALEWSRAVGLVQQMARALSAAHEHEPAIVHRDLKPENVMLQADGSLKVMDFGVAKMLAALGTATTHSVGTLAYMSPEQIDAGPIDPRSDLYALGLVFYELLAGRPPFESSSPRELLNLQCTAAPPPFSAEVRRHLPRGVERLVFELLEKAPDRRPASAADVLEALEAFAPAALPGDAPVSSRRAKAEQRRASDTTPAVSAKAPEAAVAPPAVPAVTPTRTKLDTIALIERATRAPTVSWQRALAVIAACSVLSGVATYALRAVGRVEAPRAAASRGVR
ncbi:MAG TPA: serine/threonine-protein kinase [Polyangiaceae bacterium]|nr:serine/threonine-protein kinase [Polyangiaceae bacterium]